MIAAPWLKVLSGPMIAGIAALAVVGFIVAVYIAGVRGANRANENAGLWMEKARLERALEERAKIEADIERLESENEELARRAIAAGFAGADIGDCVVADPGFMRELSNISR
jgi:hypothetical protein